MPNYCENKISLSGDPQAVKKAFSFMANGKSPLDFNKIIPYPKEFEEKDKELEKLGWDAYKAKYGHLNDGFNSGGYEWCLSNWGTKWNAVDPIRSGNTIEFQTAWTPAEPIISAIHAKNPQIGIKYTYNEPGMGYAGMQVFHPVGQEIGLAGKPTEDHQWEGAEYTRLYPDHVLSRVFEEAVHDPDNPSNHLTRDQLTKREEATALAAIKELTTTLVDGCFHTDLGPISEEGARSELTKLGNTLGILIDDKFAPEIQEVITTVAAAGRTALIERETSTMTTAKTDTELQATENAAKKPGKKKTVVPEREIFTLEEAKKKALEMALQRKDNGEEWMDFTILALTANLNSEEDREEFMDYLSSEEFSDAVQELNPKIGELSDADLLKHLEDYRANLPYSRDSKEAFVRFIANSVALTNAIGALGGGLELQQVWDYIKDVNLPNSGTLLDHAGQFPFPEDARQKIGHVFGPGYAERLRAGAEWNRIKTLFNRPDQIPEDLVNEMQATLLRMLLGVDTYPRIGLLSSSDKQFHVRDVLNNHVQSFVYHDIARFWEAFLRTYGAVMDARAREDLYLSRHQLSLHTLGEFLTTGRISGQMVNTIEEIEKQGWAYYATERVHQAIKMELGRRAAAAASTSDSSDKK